MTDTNKELSINEIELFMNLFVEFSNKIKTSSENIQKQKV